VRVPGQVGGGATTASPQQPDSFRIGENRRLGANNGLGGNFGNCVVGRSRLSRRAFATFNVGETHSPGP
jgi:hypothetical protein